MISPVQGLLYTLSFLLMLALPIALALLILGNVAIIWQLCRQPVTAVQT